MTGGRWTSYTIRTSGDAAGISRALFQLGAEAVEERAGMLVTSLRGAKEREVADAVRRVDAGATVDTAPVPDVDWSSAWRSRITAHRLGPLVVTPPWLADSFPAESRIVIDPGMAFGTGEHETTRGVIRLLPRVLRAGDIVADLGAGSAVLAIAAARLGAARVVAIEIDPDAIGNAEANVEMNGVADRVTVIEGDAGLLLPLVAPVRLIVANIISSVLLQLLPVMRECLTTGGHAILSGILVEERGEMLEALAADGWRVEADDADGMWWSVAIARA